MNLGKPKYHLRWRFDFSNKPSRFGLWDSSGPSQHTAYNAWSTNKDGLIRAAIEGKGIVTRNIRVLVACDGHNFCNLKWFAMISTGMGQYGSFAGRPVGMILQTRDLDVLYLKDGQSFTKDRTQGDKDFNYAGFGK